MKGRKNTSIRIEPGILKKLRKDHKLSQEQLGEKIGYSRETISLAERNGFIDRNCLELIAEFFDVHPDYIKGLEDSFYKYDTYLDEKIEREISEEDEETKTAFFEWFNEYIGRNIFEEIDKIENYPLLSEYLYEKVMRLLLIETFTLSQKYATIKEIENRLSEFTK